MLRCPRTIVTIVTVTIIRRGWWGRRLVVVITIIVVIVTIVVIVIVLVVLGTSELWRWYRVVLWAGVVALRRVVCGADWVVLGLFYVS